jgi:hypothetical protein
MINFTGQCTKKGIVSSKHLCDARGGETRAGQYDPCIQHVVKEEIPPGKKIGST